MPRSTLDFTFLGVLLLCIVHNASAHGGVFQTSLNLISKDVVSAISTTALPSMLQCEVAMQPFGLADAPLADFMQNVACSVKAVGGSGEEWARASKLFLRPDLRIADTEPGVCGVDLGELALRESKTI
jgi:hypothetical protein